MNVGRHVHVTQLTEDQVLQYAWQASGEPDVDRQQLLKQLSVVAINRPGDWDFAAVRAVNPWTLQGLESPDRCFCCRSGDFRLYWHHIIAVMHGGTNRRGNLVAICYRCHRVVHPWLPERSEDAERYRPSNSWVAVGDLVRELDVPVEGETRIA